MVKVRFTPLLRGVLLFDAASCALSGFGLLVFADALQQMLAIPATASQGAAIVLLVFAAGVAYVGTRGFVMRRAVWLIVSLNALWAVESVLALAFGWLEPNELGQILLIAQAVAVGAIAELQVVGVRRAASWPSVSPSYNDLQ